MKKVLFFTAAFCLIATSAIAKDMSGRFTLGATMGRDVEIGYVLDNNLRLKGGFSFASEDLGEETATSFGVGGQVLYPLMGGERADMFLTGGVNFRSYDDASLVLAGADDTSFTQFMVLAGFAFEVYFGDNFSVGADHGFAFVNTSPPGDGDSTTDFGTFSNGLTEVSFTYYFEEKQ